MRRFVPAFAIFIVEAALQVSGWHNKAVAIALLVLAVVAVIYAAWPWLRGRPEFVVMIDREEWSNFHHRARILEARVTIENTTDGRKQISALGMQGPSFMGITDPNIVAEVQGRRGRLQNLLAISQIDPHETVKGWIVHAFAHAADPGPPEYEFLVYDELQRVFSAKARRKRWRFWRRESDGA